MKTYIILAYPNKNSLTYAAYESVKKGLLESGNEIKTLDLYEENFNPVLFFDKNNKRRDMQFLPETKAYRDAILWADRLVFVFPIWWSSMPAILKGFIDKVFATGFAYEFKGIMPVGLLKGKTAWVINTHDTPSLFASLFQQDYGKVFKKQILGMCGIKTTKHFVLPSTKRTSLEKRTKWLNSIYEYAKNN